nr:ATP-binding protein [Sphingobium nicotianae]
MTDICASLGALQQGLEGGAGFALVTEESLLSADLHPLSHWLKTQPEWSDFPFILLTHKGGGLERNPSARRFLNLLGNVTFLERPFHPTTLLSLAEAALRGRRRQYEGRARLEELHSVANKYRSLFESIDVGFCIIKMVFDQAGRPIDYIFLEANPAFARQTGLDHVIGRSMKSLVPGHEQRWFDVYGQVALEGRSVRFEEHAAALGGIWYDVYAFRAGTPDQNQVAVLFNDISERRRMEQTLRDNEDRLRRLNETLEERVMERTRDLEQAQGALRQSQKLESIGQLTGGVAHDFNNLLMAIMSSVTLLQKRVPDDPVLHRLIDNALQGAQRGAALTQRMLAFARRQDLSSVQIDLAGLVRDITELVERTIGPAWSLDIRIPDDLPRVVGDANQLEMALLNLAVNARDAMPEGGAIIIAAERRHFASQEIEGLGAGRYVGLSVIDTGVGMDAETLERATEPFFTTKGIGKGTGLGLPMIHGLARQLGGTFTLTSAPGEGTTATLWLPAAQADDVNMIAPSDQASQNNMVGRLKVLAVDDDGLILMNTSALLEDLGHSVLEASSGTQALDLLRKYPDIDLLITDQAMPNMTGTQLVHHVSELRPDLPIILATGYGEVPAGFETSVVKLGKPFAQTLLAQALAQAVGKATAKQKE